MENGKSSLCQIKPGKPKLEIKDIKNLNDNKQIGLLLISLINETSKLIKEYEILLKEKAQFIQMKSKLSTDDPKELLKFDYLKENSKRIFILDNFDKIENILDDNYFIPNKVLESILVLLLKMFSDIINTIDVKRIINCTSKIIKKQLDVFSALDKLSELYDLFFSKRIVENLIKNYLMILENSNSSKTQMENKEQEIKENDKIPEGNNNSSFDFIDKEIINEIFSTFNFLYFPMKNEFKISIMPGLISKLAKFFLNNNEKYNKINKTIETNSQKNLLSKRVVLSIYKIFNHNLDLLITSISESKGKVPSNIDEFKRNFPQFFEAFKLFFDNLFKIITNDNHKTNLFSVIDLEISLNINYNLIKSSDKEGADMYANLKCNSILEEIYYSSKLIRLLSRNKNEDSKLFAHGNMEIDFDDFFQKINFILQRYIFENFDNYNNKDKKENEQLVNKNKKTIIKSYENFDIIFTYDSILKNLNDDLKTFNVFLNKQEIHKLNNILFKVSGEIELYSIKYKKDLSNKKSDYDYSRIQNDLINISWKFVECLIDKYFVFRNVKFLEYKEFSNHDFKIKEITNETCLENISNLFIQYFNLSDNNQNGNSFVSSFSLKNTEEYKIFQNSLNFIKFVYINGLMIEDLNSPNSPEQKKEVLNINVLIKNILTKNLNSIKNMKTFASKLESLHEEIEFLKQNMFEQEETNSDLVYENAVDENDDSSVGNEKNEIFECIEKIKTKYLGIVTALKDNFKSWLKNFIIILMLTMGCESVISQIDFTLLKSFRQQLNYIYSNFIGVSENDEESSLFYIVNKNDNQIITQLFSNIYSIKKSTDYGNNDQFYKATLEKMKSESKKKYENSFTNVFQEELLKSVVMMSYFTLIKHQIVKGNKGKDLAFSQLELKQILMFTLSNYANNNSHLLKFSSIVLIRALNSFNKINKLASNNKENFDEVEQDNKKIIDDSLNFKNFVLTNFDFLLNSIMKKLIFRPRDSNNKNNNHLNEIAKEKKLSITNLFYSLILLILEIEDSEIRNFYSFELNNFMNKFFVYLDEDIKNKDLFKLECSLEIMHRITEYQDKILKENYIQFLKENNKLYEDPNLDVNKLLQEEEEKQLNRFSEFLKNKSNFHNANVHRRLILRLCPLFLSNNNFLIHKFLNIFSNTLLILFMLPLEREENANFSAEDPANVQIKNSLGPLLYETWNYFVYVIKNLKNIKTLNQVLSFLGRVVRIYPNFLNEGRVFNELIPAFSQCLGDCLFKNYEVSVISNSIFSFLFNLHMLFYLNLKNTLNEEKLYLLFSIENAIKKQNSEIKFYIQKDNFEIFKVLLGKIKKFFGNKLENYKIKNLKSFIDLKERAKRFNLDKIDNNFRDALTNDNQFFEYVGSESKNIFNFGSKYYDIQNISLYFNVERELINLIIENNFDFNLYFDSMESLFVII